MPTSNSSGTSLKDAVASAMMTDSTRSKLCCKLARLANIEEDVE